MTVADAQHPTLASLGPAPAERALLERAKIECLAHGLRISPAAFDHLTDGGRRPLTVHEYATTGGITLELPGEVYVNAPFDEWFCERSSAELELEGEKLVLRLPQGDLSVVRVVPLPGYLDSRDTAGRLVTDVAMSHTDRVRLSPFDGCAFDCTFCDLASLAYQRRETGHLMEALEVAVRDGKLPVRHALISGGSPKARDYAAFEEMCTAVISQSPVPVGIMLSPIRHDVGFVERMVEAGVESFAVNIEVYAAEPALLHLGMKYKATREGFADFVRRAVDLLGSGGRVRSLIIPGLESAEETLEGVRWLAELGCDPVLSPFRPARDTVLSTTEPVSPSMLAEVLEAARGTAAGAGVALGSACVPCQHNVLAFPWDLRPEPSA